MLARAGCRLVLTERGSTAMLDQALVTLPGVTMLRIDAIYADGHSDGGLGIRVTPDQLAYIYFTSGSTGEPKGAMCEHAGMLNHLFAKIDDLRIDEGTVVAQTAPQCFDISLWQLMAALLVGGCTLLVEQEIILDAGRFIDKIVDAKVDIVQVVPPYLEVLESQLAQHPREFEHLRHVVATGEALKKELVERWFALQPRIKLVNAYGLTETSDDTNHEIMDRPPSGARVPLGRPINNVLIAVVVAERADRSKHLVAFYSSERPLDTGALRDRLGESLPTYMVPAALHWRETLPLTDNGKVDRKALTVLAGDLDAGEQNRERPG